MATIENFLPWKKKQNKKQQQQQKRTQHKLKIIFINKVFKL